MALGTLLTILIAIQILCFLLGLLFDSQFMFEVAWYCLGLMLVMIIGAFLELTLN